MTPGGGLTGAAPPAPTTTWRWTTTFDPTTGRGVCAEAGNRGGGAGAPTARGSGGVVVGDGVGSNTTTGNRASDELFDIAA